VRIGRFTVRFRYPPKPDVLLLEADKSPHLMSACGDLCAEVFRSEDRLVVVRPRYVALLIFYWARTTRMAALLCARIESQQIRILIGMENYDKFNRMGDTSRTILEDVTEQIPELRAFLVQHGQELRRFPTDRKTKRVVLFCWGEWAARNYRSFGRNEASFIPTGALIDGLYRSIRPAEIPRDVGICYVSTVKEPTWWGAEIGERRAGFEKLTQYVATYMGSAKSDVHVALTIDRDQNREEDESKLERKWFLDRLGESIQFTEPSLLFGDQNFTDHGRQTPRYVKERYASYFLSDRAEITLGMTSSVLWESFGRGNKVLAVNLTDNPIYDFPISGIWSMRQPTYEQFAARMRELLAMPQHDWLELTREARFDLIAYREDAPPHVLINQHLRKVLNELR
jgi:hypothetical protein